MILKNSEKKDNNRLEFTVESDAAEFDAAVNAAYRKNKNAINIPGFRKGKAPLAIIEGMYGPEVFYQDALDELAQPAYEKWLEEKVDFIGRPSIVAADVTPERTASFTFSVELYPEVELGEYKGLEVEKVDTEVSDEDVDKEIESARKQNARMITVEDRPAQMGDTANINFEGFLDAAKTQPFDGGKGENYDLELGSGSFVPGFEEQIVGMNAGDEKDINITFPEDYAADLAGKDVVFHVVLNGITYPELPAVDDDFAQDVSEFDTLDEYKADVKKNLIEKKLEQAKGIIRGSAVAKAIDNMKAEVPETMIRSHMEAIIRNFAANYGLNDPEIELSKLATMLGIDENTMNTAIRPSAVEEAKQELLVKAVVAKEAIEGTEEEINEYINKISGTVGATVDDIKNYFGMDYITEEFKKEKALSLIGDSAVLVDAVKEAAEEVKEEVKAKAKKTTAKKTTTKKTEKAEKTEEPAAAEEAPKKKTTRKKAAAADAPAAAEAPAEEAPKKKTTRKKAEPKTEE